MPPGLRKSSPREELGFLRARGQFTRVPVSTPSKGTPTQNPISADKQPNKWRYEGKGKKDSPNERLRGGHRGVAMQKTQFAPPQTPPNFRSKIERNK